MDMPLTASWGDISVRLALTFVAGGLIGLNREERGHAAGLRTTLLVSLAACVAMLQVNALLPLAGKPQNGFSVMDLMRLPLGILTGVGFIGGGAILKRGSLVIGVTTAATLWMATVIGLCFGGDQLMLGAVATAITLFVLWGMKAIDDRLPKVSEGTLEVTAEAGTDAQVTADAIGAVEVTVSEQRWLPEQGRQVTAYGVRYHRDDDRLLAALERIAARPGVLATCWARAERPE